MATTMFLGTSLMLTSCGGNNADMPPETITGETQETGVDYPEGMGTTTGDTIGTEGGITTGTTTGTTAGGTTAGGTTTGGI